MRSKLFSNRNIIIALSLLFVLWLLFLDRNNLVSLQDVNNQIKQMETERDFYRDMIDADSAVIKGLDDSAYVDKYARENFFLKGEGETLYLYR